MSAAEHETAMLAAGMTDGDGAAAPLKILHVLDHSLPLHSGYAFRSAALIREQRRMGWRTAHLTTPKHTNPGPDFEETDGLAFYRTPAIFAALNRIPVLGEMGLVAAAARRIVEVSAIERPHLLHAHSPALNGLACLWAARTLHLPVVYEVRGFWEDAAVSHGTTADGSWRYRASRALESMVLRRCDAVTTICDGLRRDMLARGLPAEKITIVPNGVDPEEFAVGGPADPQLRAKLRLTDRTVLGFLGSFYDYEGLDLLLAALPRLLARRPDLAVLLAGGGPAEAALQQQCHALGLNDHVRFVGRVPHSEVQKYYDLVDIFVYPRHAMRLTETVTPLKPLEAMARGGIVLASDVGGHRELVRDGETGQLFAAGDVEALVEGVLDLLRRQDAWPQLRQRARLFIERERTWQAAAQGYGRAYGHALRDDRSVGRGLLRGAPNARGRSQP